MDGPNHDDGKLLGALFDLEIHALRDLEDMTFTPIYAGARARLQVLINTHGMPRLRRRRGIPDGTRVEEAKEIISRALAADIDKDAQVPPIRPAKEQPPYQAFGEVFEQCEEALRDEPAVARLIRRRRDMFVVAKTCAADGTEVSALSNKWLAQWERICARVKNGFPEAKKYRQELETYRNKEASLKRAKRQHARYSAK